MYTQGIMYEWFVERLILSPSSEPICWYSWAMVAVWPAMILLGTVTQSCFTGTGIYHMQSEHNSPHIQLTSVALLLWEYSLKFVLLQWCRVRTLVMLTYNEYAAGRHVRRYARRSTDIYTRCGQHTEISYLRWICLCGTSDTHSTPHEWHHTHSLITSAQII